MYIFNINVLIKEMLYWNAELIEILLFRFVIPKLRQDKSACDSFAFDSAVGNDSVTKRMCYFYSACLPLRPVTRSSSCFVDNECLLSAVPNRPVQYYLFLFFN